MQTAFENSVAREVFIIPDFRGIDAVENGSLQRGLDERIDGLRGSRVLETFREMPAIVRALDAKGLIAVFDADAGDGLRVELKQGGARLDDALCGETPAVCCSNKHRKSNGGEQEEDGRNPAHARRRNQAKSPKTAARAGMPTMTSSARRDS